MGVFEGHKLISKSGELVNAEDAVAGKVIAVYFSAHWCPPCRQFTPMLKDFYEELMAEAALAIVFVSGDRTEGDMKSYFEENHGDWFAVPFDDKELSDALKSACNVSGIPKLALVNKDGKLLYGDARSDVSSTQPKVAFKKWVDIVAK